MNKFLFWFTARPLLGLISKAYGALRKVLDSIPIFGSISGPAERITDRLFSIVRFPAAFERRFEPYLEFEKGRRMDRLLVSAVLLYMAILGAYPSNLGHLDTAPQIWIALPIVSGFNPYLGLVSGLVFSAADWIGKLLPFESVYGADFGGSLQDFWGARIGYLLAYTTMIFNGMLPGVLARVFREFIGGIGRRLFPKKGFQAAMIVLLAAATGAIVYQMAGPRGVFMISAVTFMAMGMAMQPDPSAGQGAAGMPGGGPGVNPDLAAEAVATLGSVLGATVGIAASYEWAQQVGNYGAFYALRETQDVSCRTLSAGNYSNLQAQAPIPGTVAGVIPPGAGGVVTGGTPTPPSTGVPPTPQVPVTPQTPPTTQPPPTTQQPPTTQPDGQPQEGGGNPLDEYLGQGQPGDSDSAWVENEDGTLTSTGYIHDPNSGGWREAADGERDAEGNLWDATAGQWVDERTAADFQRQRRETQEMIERQRAENERRRIEGERRAREREAERQRRAAERRAAAEAERQRQRAERMAELRRRQAELEAAANQANADADWWDSATTVVEGIKLTADTAANVVAAAAPKPVGTAFGYIYGTATGVAGGMADAAVSGGSMTEGALMGGMEGVATTAVGNLVGGALPGGGSGPVSTAFGRGFSRGSGRGVVQGVIRGTSGAIQEVAHTSARVAVQQGTRATVETIVVGEVSSHLTSGAFTTATRGEVGSARVESEAGMLSTVAGWLNPFD